MLIIISDIHLGDGTCGKSISASAFRLFADRLQELAFNASWWPDGTYHPIEQIDILMLGDILDPLHSTLWLEKKLGEPGYVRPWTDFTAPEFAATLKEYNQRHPAKEHRSSGDSKRAVWPPESACRRSPALVCRIWMPARVNRSGYACTTWSATMIGTITCLVPISMPSARKSCRLWVDQSAWTISARTSRVGRTPGLA